MGLRPYAETRLKDSLQSCPRPAESIYYEQGSTVSLFCMLKAIVSAILVIGFFPLEANALPYSPTSESFLEAARANFKRYGTVSVEFLRVTACNFDFVSNDVNPGASCLVDHKEYSSLGVRTCINTGLSFYQNNGWQLFERHNSPKPECSSWVALTPTPESDEITLRPDIDNTTDSEAAPSNAADITHNTPEKQEAESQSPEVSESGTNTSVASAGSNETGGVIKLSAPSALGAVLSAFLLGYAAGDFARRRMDDQDE